MSNPLFNMMNNMPMMSDIAQIGQIMNLFRNSNNPMALFAQLAGQDPQMQPILNALQRGANPEQIYRQECQRQGVNADQFLQSLQGR